MATVTGYTAARMQEIEDNAITGGEIDDDDHLILTRHGGGTVDAGLLPPGPPGPPGDVSGTVGSTDNRVVRTDGTGGTTVQGSLVSIDDAGKLSMPSGAVTTAPTADEDVVNKEYSDNSGRGQLGSTSTDTQESTTVDNWKTLTGLAITITPVVGRLYQFKANVSFIGTNAVACAVAVYRSTDLVNPIVRADGGTLLLNWPATVIADRTIEIPGGWGTSTQFIVRVWATGDVDTASHIDEATFTITDVGVA